MLAGDLPVGNTRVLEFNGLGNACVLEFYGLGNACVLEFNGLGNEAFLLGMLLLGMHAC